MPVELIDGFYSYNSVAAVVQENWTIRQPNFPPGSWQLYNSPTYGGKGLIASGDAFWRELYKGMTSRSELSFGFLWGISGTAGLSTAQSVFVLGYANGAPFDPSVNPTQLRTRVMSDGSIDLIIANNCGLTTPVLASSAAGVIQAGKEYLVTVECVIDNTAGEFRMWLNDDQVFDLSGVDTQALASSNVDYIFWMAAQFDYVQVKMGGHFWLSDESTGPGVKLRIDAIVPVLDGLNDGFTAVPPPFFWADVEELPLNTADYIAGSLPGDNIMMTVGELRPVSITNIPAVQVVGWMNKTDGATREVNLAISSGGVPEAGPTIPLSTTVSYDTHLMLEDPDTTAPWIQNSVEAIVLIPTVVT